MKAQRWHDSDINLDDIKKDRIAVIGYGIQGRAQANNMKDSGLEVLVGLRRGGKSWDLAEKEGHKVMSAAEATKEANIVHVLVPDMEQSTL
jgi:ketol-acid reductoisomerase